MLLAQRNKRDKREISSKIPFSEKLLVRRRPVLTVGVFLDFL